MLRKKMAVMIMMVSINSTAFAGGGAGGATEVTQLLNNTELVTLSASQADMVTNQISQFIQETTGLPVGKVMQNLSLYRDMAPYLQALGVTQQLSDSAKRASALMSGEVSTMTRLNMDPRTYTQNMIQLSKERGGYYKQSLDNTTNAMVDVQKRGEALAQMHDQIPQIDGNVKGMQTLATTNLQMVGEMQNLNYSILQMKADSDRRGMKTEDDVSVDQSKRLEFEKGKAAMQDWEKSVMQSKSKK